jgi:hypothetical protein
VDAQCDVVPDAIGMEVADDFVDIKAMPRIQLSALHLQGSSHLQGPVEDEP